MAYLMKRGSTTPPLATTLGDANGPVRIDTAVVLFRLKRVNGLLVVSSAATIVDDGTVAKRGKAIYVWQVGDTDVSGVYRGEWKATFADGTVETFPSDDWNDIVIRDTLN